ncbi:type IV pilin accessory protein [Pseudomonas sp. o96-267]|uniref:TfpX/TfpZ family type IV pilin accessory protein n=1 Tax=Pseudomonas sp. o96-267 TaxID=2479853 RepID=UPI000F76AED3|nr:TfpX/TfpZ family type IV pilin accessory protein [Pseudomonas sp. o96-267]RRV42892.1 type IV pilin accessory protein [Pseudomonas sp. o96-267]
MPLRLKAFLLHLGLSGIIALLAMWVVFKLWYPAPLHTAVGVTHIFLLLLLVDVILGPLLTLLVYKEGKKTLVFDLSVIAALQLSALGYGLWAVAEGRPAWLVFNTDRFDLVRVLDVDTRKLDQAAPEFRQPSWLGPRWVAAAPPSDSAAHNELIFESVQGGSDLPQRPDLYRPIADSVERITERSSPLSELQKFNSADEVQSAISQWPEADAWLPLMAGTPMVVLLRKETAEVVAVVDLRPWL